MSLSYAATAVAAGEKLRELPVPPIAFGLIALAAFGALLVVTYAFRSVSNRH